MNLAEYLQSRAQAKEDANAITEKSYVPYGIYSFGDLEKIQVSIDFREKLREMYWDFVSIGDNILMDYPDQAGERLIALVTEFNSRLQAMQKKLTSGNVALFKSDDGILYWAGVPTNKFEDREKDIFSDISHRTLVKSLDEGTHAYPELFIWHQRPAVGITTWVDYDDRGFLVAGGTVHKEYEDLVINLVTNLTEPLGMSQGIFTKDIKRDSENTIIEYFPFEFTFLPHKNACNSLTAFTTN
jgi:hypothetical protein